MPTRSTSPSSTSPCPAPRVTSIVARLREQAPALLVIVLSGSEDVELMCALMDLGVLGFIPKAYSPR